MHAMNQSHQKEYNRSLVLHSLSLHTSLSRVDLAKMLNLKKSSITAIVSDLIDLGILKEVGFGEGRSKGGRKPIMLSLEESFGVVVGVDLQPQSAYITVCNIRGEVLVKDTFEFSKDDLLLPFMDKLTIIFRWIQRIAVESSLEVIGVSLGIPGWVDSRQGVVLRSIPFSLEQFNFAEEIKKMDLPFPVLIENDANCGAWSEVKHRVNSFRDSLFLLFVSRPVIHEGDSLGGIALGLGITLNGEIYTGSDYSAGDFTSAFWTTAQSGQVGIDDNIMKDLIDEGKHPVASRRYIKEVLQNLIPLISVLAPQRIILGGSGCGKLDTFKQVIQSELSESFLNQNGVGDLFSESVYGLYAPALGASRRFLWELFFPMVPAQQEPYYYKGLKSLFND